jgi:ribosome-associated heat shock protein Hsp15
LTRPEDPQAADAAPGSQRIDKWLWCARLFKTRTLATKVVMSGGVRLTRHGATARIGKASALVRAGDQLAFMCGARLRILEIQACAERRGPAAQARLLYTDHSPKAASPPKAAARETGAGRPTKKDRRAIDRLNDAAWKGRSSDA